MRLFSILVLAVMATPLMADELGDRLAKLRITFSEELKKTAGDDNKPENKAQRDRRNQELLSLMAVVERGGAGERGEQVEYMRQAVTSSSTVSPQLREQILALLDELPALLKARQEEFRKSVDAALDAARKAVSEAAAADSLNGVLGELEALRQSQWRSESRLNQQSGEQLNEAMQAIAKWQEYLRNREAGYPEAAQNSLQQLLQERSSYPFLKAEVIQAALAGIRTDASDPMNEVARILQSVQKASDIPAAAQNIGRISPGPRDEGRLQSITQRLRSFATTYAAAQYGFSETAGTTTFNIDNTNPLMPELLRIENLLRLDLLARAFAALKAGPPEEGENQQTYTARLVETAAKSKDWESMERILVFANRALGRQQADPTATAQIAALQAFNTAKKLEIALQYSQAIQSYRKVLASAAPNLPVDEASERLKVLTSEHKEAVAQADREEEIRAIVRSAVESAPRRNPGMPY